MIAQRLSAEQILILYSAIDSIPNPDQREAALLQAEGYSIGEIATENVTTDAIRILMCLGKFISSPVSLKSLFQLHYVKIF